MQNNKGGWINCAWNINKEPLDKEGSKNLLMMQMLDACLLNNDAKNNKILKLIVECT